MCLCPWWFQFIGLEARNGCLFFLSLLIHFCSSQRTHVLHWRIKGVYLWQKRRLASIYNENPNQTFDDWEENFVPFALKIFCRVIFAPWIFDLVMKPRMLLDLIGRHIFCTIRSICCFRTVRTYFGHLRTFEFRIDYKIINFAYVCINMISPIL